MTLDNDRGSEALVALGDASAIPEPWLEKLHGRPGYAEDDLRRVALSAAGEDV